MAKEIAETLHDVPVVDFFNNTGERYQRRGVLLSDDDVIALCNVFLMPGNHRVICPDTRQGRILVMRVLTSLGCFNRTACLTLLRPPGCIDVFQELLVAGALIDAESLEAFFIENFFYDFLWIEETPQLLDQPWYESFRHCMKSLSFAASIPVVTVAYDQSTILIS